MLEGMFPDKLKMAKIVRIYKNGDISLAGNYRPISLLSVFDKLLETLVYKRVYTILVKHNIFYKYQFSLERIILQPWLLLKHIIYNKLDEQQYLIGMYLDLQKAFDTVNQEILLHKLYNYIRVAYEWFRSYLSNRQQFPVVDGTVSSLAKITFGVL